MSEKTETKSSAAQNPFLRMADAQMAQIHAFYEEVEKLQTAGMEKTVAALDESARLSRETLGYFATLGAESRRQSLDAYKRSLAFLIAGDARPVQG